MKKRQVVHKSAAKRETCEISDKAVRYRLSLVITAAIALVSTIAVFKPEANSVLEQLLPVLMLIIGYYYGQK